MRFSTCSKCRAKTLVRKSPLVIHVEGPRLLCLNKTCRLCPACDLLYVHKDQLEAELAAIFEQHAPECTGKDYLVLGTVDRQVWRRSMSQPMTPQQIFAEMHDFRDHLLVQPAP